MRAISIIVLALIVAACSSSGDVGVADATNTSVSQQVTRGKTTQAEVRQLYGAPSKVALNGAEETWTFTHTRSSVKPTTFIPLVGPLFSGTDTESAIVVFVFDKNKVVRDYTTSK